MGGLAPGALATAFAAGVFSAPHCLGMCGALTAACGVRGMANAAGANAGRIASYALAGAFAGLLGQGALLARGAQPLLLAAAGAFTVTLGLAVAGWVRIPAAVESLGAGVWAKAAPLLRPLVPVRSLPQALAFGLLWGWVPCGLVYATLLLALMQGSATAGAAVMLAFGAGTALHLLPAGFAAGRMRALRSRPRLRAAAGLVVAMLGLWTLVHVILFPDSVMANAWGGLLCVSPTR